MTIHGTKQPDRGCYSSSEIDFPSDNYDSLNLSRIWTPRILQLIISH